MVVSFPFLTMETPFTTSCLLSCTLDPLGANSFLSEPLFQKGLGIKEAKQEVPQVVSL